MKAVSPLGRRRTQQKALFETGHKNNPARPGINLRRPVQLGEASGRPRTYGDPLTSEAVTSAVNTPATDRPSITSPASPRLGTQFTAVTSAIMDDSSLTGVTFSYQWVRVDGKNETDITEASAALPQNSTSCSPPR